MKLEPATKNSFVISELLNGIPHGIAILDTNLCIVAMNCFLEAMTGYITDEARGVYIDFIIRSNFGSKDEAYSAVLENGQPVSISGDIINRRRKKIPIHFNLSRLHDKQNRPSGVLIVLEDISALRAEGVAHQKESERFGILGHSLQMENVFKLMSVLARTDASILITGETGTGKDMVAESLHKSSRRARQPFIKINCGALPEALLESELFGHTRGAFTGAVHENPGMFRLAHGGTIFLTEIGDLSLPLQVKLLSVLDDQEFFPVGGRKKIQVDVRIIAATHRSLRHEVQQGHFREDLFYRLNVLHLHIPPVRERSGDIRLLCDHFLRQISATLGRNITGFTKKTIDTLCRYHYPGNVRELRNIVEYSVNICQGKKIKTKDLPQYLFKPPESSSTITAPINPSRSATATQGQPAGKAGGGWVELEKEMITEALRKTGGNRSKAAEMLGWGRTTLWRKLKKYKVT